MELRPISAALKRQPDLVDYALRIHPVAGRVVLTPGGCQIGHMPVIN
jgi:hypothetical protein